jgi:hypothetical protein
MAAEAEAEDHAPSARLLGPAIEVTGRMHGQFALQGLDPPISIDPHPPGSRPCRPPPARRHAHDVLDRHFLHARRYRAAATAAGAPVAERAAVPAADAFSSRERLRRAGERHRDRDRST